MQPSGLPMGISGKSTTALSSTYKTAGVAEADCIMGAVGSSSSHGAPVTHRDILDENKVHVRHNDTHTDHRATTSDIIKDDKLMLDVPSEESSRLPEPHPINTNTQMINVFRNYIALIPGSRAGFESLMAKYCHWFPKSKQVLYLVLWIHQLHMHIATTIWNFHLLWQDLWNP